MAFDTPINSNDQSFDRVLNAGLPVVGVFSAGAPDAALEDVLKSSAKGDSGNLLIAKIRVEENPNLVKRFSIRAPTLITFRDGKEYSRVEMPGAAEARAHIEYVVGRGPKPKGRQAADDGRPSTSSSPNGDGHPFKVTDATFAREVLGASLPVMVDFWADWCGPCHMIAPSLEKLAGEYAGRVRIAKLNVDENPRTQAQYQVQSIPTLLLVKNGKVVDRIVGAHPEGNLRTQIERLLKA